MTPDPERAIIAALVHYMPDLVVDGRPRIYSQAQDGWAGHDHLIVRATGGGSSRQPRHWVTCYFEIEAFASTRGNASLLARRAGQALAQAARDNFRYEDGDRGGYLFSFIEVNAPHIVYDGLSSKHGDTFMFQGTYQINIRPLR